MAQSVEKSALEKNLDQWVAAGVLDTATAERIRGFEQSRRSSDGLRWPVLLALALGGVLLCAGVLLFVAAHWDELSPAWRKPGEELWIEVTVPKKGPPRPIRLAIKRGETFTPLDFK